LLARRFFLETDSKMRVKKIESAGNLHNAEEMDIRKAALRDCIVTGFPCAFATFNTRPVPAAMISLSELTLSCL